MRLKKVLVLSVLSCALLLLVLVFVSFLPLPMFVASVKKNRYVMKSHRELAEAIVRFHAQYGHYPPACPMKEFCPESDLRFLKDHNGDSFSTLAPGNPSLGVNGLTTPIAFIPAIPGDLLGQHIPPAYYAGGESWALVSPGLDLQFDCSADQLRKAVESSRGSLRAIQESFLLYDPTNGSFTSGDIVTAGNRERWSTSLLRDRK
jgi:hypothetical protein